MATLRRTVKSGQWEVQQGNHADLPAVVCLTAGVSGVQRAGHAPERRQPVMLAVFRPDFRCVWLGWEWWRCFGT